jgi:hypothetical protein
MNSTFILAHIGWRSNSLIPGMDVTVTIHPLRDDTNGGQFLTITMPDGRQMNGGHPTTLGSMRARTTAAERALAQFRQRSACDLLSAQPEPD